MRAALAAVLALALGGCIDTETALGRCVGVNDDEMRNPALVYKVDTGNVIWGLVLIETIFVPAIVVLDDLYCPVARRSELPRAAAATDAGAR